MKKGTIFIFGVLALFILVTFLNPNLGEAKSENYVDNTFHLGLEKSQNFSKITLKILNDSVATFGREKWKKGETITFKLNSKIKDIIEFGILKAENLDDGWGYNDYGKIIKKEVASQSKAISFTVPEDGEYGIYVSLKQDKNAIHSLFNKTKNLERVYKVNNEKRIAKKSNETIDLLEKDCTIINFEINRKFQNLLVSNNL